MPCMSKYIQKGCNLRDYQWPILNKSLWPLNVNGKSWNSHARVCSTPDWEKNLRPPQTKKKRPPQTPQHHSACILWEVLGVTINLAPMMPTDTSLSDKKCTSVTDVVFSSGLEVSQDKNLAVLQTKESNQQSSDIQSMSGGGGFP